MNHSDRIDISYEELKQAFLALHGRDEMTCVDLWDQLVFVRYGGARKVLTSDFPYDSEGREL